MLFVFSSCKKDAKVEVQKVEKHQEGMCMTFGKPGQILPAQDRPTGFSKITLEGNKSLGWPTIYLDFDGEYLPANTAWQTTNNLGNINIDACNFTEAEKAIITHYVRDDFWPLQIEVTTDINYYNAAATDRRAHITITPTDYFNAPSVQGLAIVNSFVIGGTNSPYWKYSAFVTTGNIDSAFGGIGFLEQVARVISHEAGHTMNAQHYGTWSGGNLSYYLGLGNNAPESHVGIMSTSPNIPQKMCTWWIGGNITSNPNNNVDDLANFAGYTGWRPDDAVKHINEGPITQLDFVNYSQHYGYLHQSDTDLWRVYYPVNATYTIENYYQQSYSQYGNIDIVVRTYNSALWPQNTYNISGSLHAANITIPKNGYFMVYGNLSNPNVVQKNMTGLYKITRL